jgi:uncharacterized membrane protein YgcG
MTVLLILVGIIVLYLIFRFGLWELLLDIILAMLGSKGGGSSGSSGGSGFGGGSSGSGGSSSDY